MPRAGRSICSLAARGDVRRVWMCPVPASVGEGSGRYPHLLPGALIPPSAFVCVGLGMEVLSYVQGCD
eukprot:scaffold99844_cov35-Tisochrysis_lutea.AAC.2